jgi:hypothetical protein
MNKVLRDWSVRFDEESPLRSKPVEVECRFDWSKITGPPNPLLGDVVGESVKPVTNRYGQDVVEVETGLAPLHVVLRCSVCSASIVPNGRYAYCNVGIKEVFVEVRPDGSMTALTNGGPWRIATCTSHYCRSRAAEFAFR